MIWKRKTLGDISLSIQTGPFGSQLHQSDYSDEGTPVVMPKDLVNGTVSEESIARVSKEHVERLKNYTENNKDMTVETEEIHDILKQGELLFTTKLRNCMMHYNLENAGVLSFANIDKPFYGIIENCFDGKSYQEYLIELHGLSERIIDFLNNQFDFSDVKLERL